MKRIQRIKLRSVSHTNRQHNNVANNHTIQKKKNYLCILYCCSIHHSVTHTEPFDSRCCFSFAFKTKHNWQMISSTVFNKMITLFALIHAVFIGVIHNNFIHPYSGINVDNLRENNIGNNRERWCMNDALIDFNFNTD